MGNYIDEFRNSEAAMRLGQVLKNYKGKPIKIMEVCGTHTMAIFKYGIRELLPENIKLISGPGCPVCVTPAYYINSAVALAKQKGVILTTFGDMMRVPGSGSTLLTEKALGADVRIVYSPLDSLKIAKENPEKHVVFLSIGFETTTPITALTVINAKEAGYKNFSVQSANKTIPEALKVLSADKEIGVNGYLYPGHVSAIIGTSLYDEVAKEYGIPGVVTGFEPLDVMHAIITLATNINKNNKIMENEYSRVVKREGNPIAIEKMNTVFEPVDAVWRGIGKIKRSGMGMRDSYSSFDAWKIFEFEEDSENEPKGCLCGEVLKGMKTPKECALYGKACTPEKPVGACMVSSEGTCAAYYKYS
jgi:hydrogenase expression/formation protein HypD